MRGVTAVLSLLIGAQAVLCPPDSPVGTLPTALRVQQCDRLIHLRRDQICIDDSATANASRSSTIAARHQERQVRQPPATVLHAVRDARSTGRLV